MAIIIPMPWNSKEPGPDAERIAALGAGLSEVANDPAPHVDRLEALRELLDLSAEARGNPAGPGGRIELIDSPTGERIAVLANEVICRTADLDAVAEAIDGLGARILEREFDEAIGIVRVAIDEESLAATDMGLPGVLTRCTELGLLAGPNEVTMQGGGWRAKAQTSPEPTDRPFGDRPTRGPGSGITVAVIDGGFATDPRADDWFATVVGPNDAGEPLDSDNVPGLDAGAGHGTFVTGIVLQVAPGCTVRQYRMLNSSGFGSAWRLKDAIVQAVADGCDIINLSVGFEPGSEHGSLPMTACMHTIPANVLVVAAAGNSGSAVPVAPAALKGVIAVGALDGNLEGVLWSNHGPWIDVSCVGEGVVSTFVPGTEEPGALPSSTTFDAPDPIALWSGTSFAAPQVTGRLAQLRSVGLSSADAISALRAAAVQENGPADPLFGYRLRIL